MQPKIGKLRRSDSVPEGFEEAADFTLEEKLSMLREMSATRKATEKARGDMAETPDARTLRLLSTFNTDGVLDRLARRRKAR